MAGPRLVDARGPVLCEWFVMCRRNAIGTVAEESAGVVPACARCARTVGLPLNLYVLAPDIAGRRSRRSAR